MKPVVDADLLALHNVATRRIGLQLSGFGPPGGLRPGPGGGRCAMLDQQWHSST